MFNASTLVTHVWHCFAVALYICPAAHYSHFEVTEFHVVDSGQALQVFVSGSRTGVGYLHVNSLVSLHLCVILS